MTPALKLLTLAQLIAALRDRDDDDLCRQAAGALGALAVEVAKLQAKLARMKRKLKPRHRRHVWVRQPGDRGFTATSVWRCKRCESMRWKTYDGWVYYARPGERRSTVPLPPCDEIRP